MPTCVLYEYGRKLAFDDAKSTPVTFAAGRFLCQLHAPRSAQLVYLYLHASLQCAGSAAQCYSSLVALQSELRNDIVERSEVWGVLGMYRPPQPGSFFVFVRACDAKLCVRVRR